MNRFLQWFNFAGVLLLVVLSVSQWSANREANLEINRLESVRISNEKVIAEKEQELLGAKSDLDSFREQLRDQSARLKKANDLATSNRREIAELSAERDQLKQAVESWSAAVADRDARLKEQNEMLRQLSADRNKAVTDFNQLGEKYNGVVADLNKRTDDFNALVEKYNSLAKSVSSK
jgi:chromosome segregation ATPase